MRRMLLLLPILVVAVGCSSGSGQSVDEKDTQAAIADLFQNNAAEAPAKSSCEGTLAAQAGATVKCKADDSAGKTWPVTAKVAKVEGDKVDVEATFDDQLVALADARDKVARMYRQFSEGPVRGVDCKGLQKLEVNSVRQCTVTEAGGKTVPVTFAISSVKGDQYFYSVRQAG
ncbi:DUF4333 domain-containing protein [Nocardia sp. CDC159]|uniref:DUF4333 domain-containing protein n=1 Tax=Nocardia pulmonis TaxID=2951408 RepID=A0A9X2EC33_9NOCA|nr:MULTISPECIES: DUF4333 domain-containing protein [Nocardia]MCM6776745.1 DUF4333 domain-containing protein [Nocardia pulmonis]MCM6789106.1 DUF4333 domain-containing protein [Nocardia sp. CDC159]